jgi:hypothetical protein
MARTPEQTRIYNQTYYQKHKDDPDFLAKKKETDKLLAQSEAYKAHRKGYMGEYRASGKASAKAKAAYACKKDTPEWKAKAAQYRAKYKASEKGKQSIKEYSKKVSESGERAEYLLAYHLRPEAKVKSEESRKRRQVEMYRQLFNIYGKKCVCCGESNLNFLTIDHINGDGAAHRKETSSHTVEVAVKEADPSKYRILCFNCNCGRQYRGVDGQCPHCAPGRLTGIL